MINYSDSPLLRLKEVSPFFYELYNLAVFISYIGFVIISWYFINLAYTINTPSYDILCIGCNLSSHLVNVTLLLFWIFFLYLYILNEIRFRFVHYTSKSQKDLIRRNNLIFVVVSLILTLITLFITL